VTATPALRRTMGSGPSVQSREPQTRLVPERREDRCGAHKARARHARLARHGAGYNGSPANATHGLRWSAYAF